MTNRYNKILFLTAILQILIVKTALSDKSWTIDGKGGSMFVLDKEHASISMVRQWVRMDIHEKEYSVKAQFVFHNDGPSVDVKMGFPERNESPIEYNKYGFLSYKEQVDGKPIHAERVKEITNKDITGYEEKPYLWTTKLHFNRNQTRVVRVEYRAKSGHEMLGEKIAMYSFTGKNWRNNNSEANFLAVMHLSGPHRLMIGGDQSCLRVSGNRISGRWTNWPASATIELWYGPTSRNAVYLRANNAEDEKSRKCREHYLMLPGPENKEVVFPNAILVENIIYVDYGNFWDLIDPQHKCKVPYPRDINIDVLECPDRKIKFTNGVSEMEINDRKTPLPSAPFRTGAYYIPARAAVEALGGNFSFDKETRMVHISF